MELQKEIINECHRVTRGLQERIHDSDLYLEHNKCVLCNQMLKLHCYKHKGLTWVHSYSHYLSEHNVKINEELLQILN